MTEEELSGENWLTQGLIDEIEKYHPFGKDIDQRTNARDKTVLASQAANMFPEGRMFASCEQLKQALLFFGDAWGFNSSFTGGKQFMCSFGRDSSKKGKHKTKTNNND